MESFIRRITETKQNHMTKLEQFNETLEALEKRSPRACYHKLLAVIVANASKSQPINANDIALKIRVRRSSVQTPLRDINGILEELDSRFRVGRKKMVGQSHALGYWIESAK